MDLDLGSAAPALSAHEAMAISMHNNGDSEQAIRRATGLSKTELSDLIAGRVLGLPRSRGSAPRRVAAGRLVGFSRPAPRCAYRPCRGCPAH